jgi:hypothetical protein
MLYPIVAKAKLLYRNKDIYPDGAIVEIKVWVVPPSPRTPEGYKYSMAYIDRNGKRVLGYDNAEGKGHHRHEGKKETPYLGVYRAVGTTIYERSRGATEATP